MKDSDWELLYELYQTKSITKTANHLFISQPALSKRLTVIENEFQVKIVNRSSKGIEFTEAGIVLAQNAETFMGMMDRVKKQLREIQEKNELVITVGVPYTFANLVFEKLLCPYSDENPNVHFEMINGSSDRIFNKILDGSIDLGFVRGDYESEEIERRKVHTCKAYAVAKEGFSIDDLPNMQRLKYRSNPNTQCLINRWWFERFHSPMPDGISVGDYVDMACNVALSGQGYVCCFLNEEDSHVDSINKIPLTYKDGTEVTRNTWCCYRKNQDIPAGIKKLLNYMKEVPAFITQ